MLILGEEVGDLRGAADVLMQQNRGGVVPDEFSVEGVDVGESAEEQDRKGGE